MEGSDFGKESPSGGKPKYQLSEKRKKQMRDYSRNRHQFKLLTDPDYLVDQRKKSAANRKSIHDLPPAEQARVRAMKQDSREKCKARKEMEKLQGQKGVKTENEEDMEIPRKRLRTEIEEDMEIPRKRLRSETEEDMEIPRRRLRPVKRINYAEQSSTETHSSSESELIDSKAEYEYHRSRYRRFLNSLDTDSSEEMQEENERVLEAMIAEEAGEPEHSLEESDGSEADSVPSMVGSVGRDHSDATKNHTMPEINNYGKHQKAVDGCQTDGRQSDKRVSNCEEKEYQPECENFDTEYRMGEVSETEVMFIDSSSDPETERNCLKFIKSEANSESRNVLPHTPLQLPESDTASNKISDCSDVIILDSDSETDFKPKLAVKSEVIVIQPDSDIESISDVASEDIKIETEKNSSEETASVACKNVQLKNNHPCMLKLVRFLLKNANITINTTETKSCIHTDGTDKEAMGNVHSSNNMVPNEEEVEATLGQEEVEATLGQEKSTPPPHDTETIENDMVAQLRPESEDDNVNESNIATNAEGQELVHKTHTLEYQDPAAITEGEGMAEVELSTVPEPDKPERSASCSDNSPDKPERSDSCSCPLHVPKQSSLVRRPLARAWRQPTGRNNNPGTPKREPKAWKYLPDFCILV